MVSALGDCPDVGTEFAVRVGRRYFASFVDLIDVTNVRVSSLWFIFVFVLQVFIPEWAIFDVGAVWRNPYQASAVPHPTIDRG